MLTNYRLGPRSDTLTAELAPHVRPLEQTCPSVPRQDAAGLLKPLQPPQEKTNEWIRPELSHHHSDGESLKEAVGAPGLGEQAVRPRLEEKHSLPLRWTEHPPPPPHPAGDLHRASQASSNRHFMAGFEELLAVTNSVLYLLIVLNGMLCAPRRFEHRGQHFIK